MHTQSREILTPGSFQTRFAQHDPSVAIRAITAALCGIWNGHQPKSPRVASKRAKVMNGQADPIGYAYTITLGAIDERKTLAEATKWAHDLLAFAAQYHARLPIQGAGVLPFHQTFTQLVGHGCIEEGEANAATATMDENDPASIRTAEKQLQEEIDVDLAKLDRLRARRVALEARG